MVSPYDLFRKIAQSDLTEKERDVNQIKNDLLNDFESTPSFYSVKINNISQDVHIITDKVGQKKMLSKPNESFDIGDVVDVEEWGNSKWLIWDIDGDNQIQTQGFIMECYDTLKVYKPDISSSIIEVYYTVLDSISLTRMGYDESHYMSLPSGRMLLLIANNEINREIKRDDVYNLKGYDNYEVADINRIRFDGLIVLEMEYSQKSQEEYIYELNILNGESIQISETQDLTIVAQLKVNDVIVDNPSLVFSSSDEEIATIDENGSVTVIDTGIVTFTVALTSDSSVSDSIEVEIVEEEVDNYTYELTGASNIYLGYSEQYVANKFNNGGLVHDAEFTFNILDDVPISAYSLVIDSDTECTITANQVNYNITLRATDDSNGEFVEKIITLRNLF